MKDKQTSRDAIKIWHYLKNNPEATYEELESVVSVPSGKANYINALIKKLQRGAYIEVIRQRDNNGRITTSYKKVVMEPKIVK